MLFTKTKKTIRDGLVVYMVYVQTDPPETVIIGNSKQSLILVKWLKLACLPSPRLEHN